jgi:hypothetical protein
MKSLYFSLLIFLLFISVNAWSASRYPINATSVWRVDHIRNGVSDEVKHENGDDISKYFLKGIP